MQHEPLTRCVPQNHEPNQQPLYIISQPRLFGYSYRKWTETETGTGLSHRAPSSSLDSPLVLEMGRVFTLHEIHGSILTPDLGGLSVITISLTPDFKYFET
jgi:hypothetical protein